MYNNSVDKFKRGNDMISAKEARTFFSPDKKEIEEHTQGRVNEILNIINRAIESVYENDKKIVIPIKLGDSSYPDNEDGYKPISVYEHEHKRAQFHSIGNIVVNQNNLYIGEGHEVLSRVFDGIEKLGFEVWVSSSTEIDGFSVRDKVYETLTISWE